MEFCIPPKADDPETPKYIDMATMFLDRQPDLINMVDENEEAPVFKAAEKGSLPHVQLFLDREGIVDRPNVLGNTALWIASAKRYPCIIDELLNRCADINWVKTWPEARAILEQDFPDGTKATVVPDGTIQYLV